MSASATQGGHKQPYLLHVSSQYGELRPTNGWNRFGTPQQISTGFASWLRYCSDVAHQRPTKLCTMFGRILDWYTIFGGSCPLSEFCQVQNSLCVQVLPSILAALLHGTPASGVSRTLRSRTRNGILQNFRRGLHLYSEERPSRWAM